jgi:hypothetical protein
MVMFADGNSIVMNHLTNKYIYTQKKQSNYVINNGSIVTLCIEYFLDWFVVIS